MSEWISVKDRLPEHGQLVLVCGDYWNIEKYPHWSGTFDCPGVTHWMPLPDPPKEGVSQ